jgi:hypothetical protein
VAERLAPSINPAGGHSVLPSRIEGRLDDDSRPWGLRLLVAPSRPILVRRRLCPRASNGSVRCTLSTPRYERSDMPAAESGGERESVVARALADSRRIDLPALCVFLADRTL